MMRIAAIDQGTTSTRGFVLDQTGTGTIVYARRHQQFYPRTGWVEHDPKELLHHVKECIKAAGAVDAIGFDNQGESCLGWNKDTGEAISPVIVWQDRRTENAISKLKNEGAEKITLEKSGLPLDPYFSASKLAWILENIPAAKKLLQKGKLRFGTTDAFFIDHLTGNFVTDITTASRTALLNLKTGQWDRKLCDLFKIPMETLPEIRPAIGDFGTINSGGSSVRLTASVVDQQASLYGHGCRKTGDTKITFGTGAFALALTGNSISFSPENGVLPTIAWQDGGKPPIYAMEGGVYCAGSALNWAKSLGLFSDFKEINQFSSPPAITRGLAFVPALTGLGSPHWDGSAAGLWIGMSLDTSAKDMVQAILEGIAFRTSQIIDTMNSLVPVGSTISVDGGMSQNPWFCQFLSNLLQKRIITQTSGEITVSGTALMAAKNLKINFAPALQTVDYEPGALINKNKSLFEEALSRSRSWRKQGPK